MAQSSINCGKKQNDNLFLSKVKLILEIFFHVFLTKQMMIGMSICNFFAFRISSTIDDPETGVQVGH